MKPVEKSSPTNEDWIAFLFDNRLPHWFPVTAISELHPEHYPDTEEGKRAKGMVLRGKPYPNPFIGVNHPDFNTYLNCASFQGKQDFRKDKEHYAALHSFMLDDVGKKVPLASLTSYPPPAMKLETSEGNWQWIYKLDPPIPDYDIAKQFVAALVRAVPNDGAGPSRWMRMPVGYNTKRHFRHQVSEFNQVAYHPDEIVEAFNLVLEPVPEYKPGVKVAGAGLIADWLSEMGMVKSQGRGWLEITCPWSRAITPGGHDDSTGTRYFLPSEPTDEHPNGFPNGGFKCQHVNKCGHRNVHDLIEWCVRMAGRIAA